MTYPNLLTLPVMDEVIKVITDETGSEELNELCKHIGHALEHLKKRQLNLINELLAIYDSASEHNVDVDRRVLFRLAQHLATGEAKSVLPGFSDSTDLEE